MLNVPWVAAALHPRLYAAARIRGLRYDIHALYKNVGNDKALLCRLLWQAENVKSRFAQKFG